MFDKLKKLADKAKNVATTAAIQVGDLNGDGKVDEEDFRIAAEWAKKKANTIGDEASRLGKDALRSDMVKDVTATAAAGAAIAIPVPFIGPLAGATIGAGLGVYKNIVSKESSNNSRRHATEPKDMHTELLKLDDLRQKNIITEDEFETHKKIILREQF
jgi:hypothetical protein